MSIQRSQAGFALLIFVLVLLTGSFIALSKSLNSSIIRQSKDQQLDNIKRLNDAKKALLSYSVEYLKKDKSLADMGKLPCPDRGTNGYGSQDPNCDEARRNSIGYFPYKTIGLGKTEDAYGECFWYVVSSRYKENPSFSFLNADSSGFINVQDEDSVLQHGSDHEDFPVALIISPGVNIGKSRLVKDGSDCVPDYTVTNYLEGGSPPFTYNPVVAKDYDTNLPSPDDAIWKFLQPSANSQNTDVDYNDHIIAIYRDEIWDAINKLGDMSFNNAKTPPSDPPRSSIERLTKSLAECIARYGNEAAGGPSLTLPHPSLVDIAPAAPADEYSKSDNYISDSSILVGRYPQDLDNGVSDHFVSDRPADGEIPSNPSYCAGGWPVVTVPPVDPVPGLDVTPYNQAFWENWKDHFFYLVSKDFQSTSTVSGGAKCTAVADCVSVNSGADKVAAIVNFSGPSVAANPEPRRWFRTESGSAVVDTKSQITNYLEGDNATPYLGGVKNFDISDLTTDYSYCIEYIHALWPKPFRAIKCNDMDDNATTL